ncbi:hypothetical protein ACP4OV_002037 [Aristida adscensionis]
MASPEESSERGRRSRRPAAPATDDGAPPHRDWLHGHVQPEEPGRRSPAVGDGGGGEPDPASRLPRPARGFHIWDPRVGGGRVQGPFTLEEAVQYPRGRGRRWGTRASSAAAADHPGTERPETRTRVRQSVLYSDRPRGQRHRRGPTPAQEPGNMGSNSGEVQRAAINLPSFDGLSISDSSLLTSQTNEYDDYLAEENLSEVTSDEPRVAVTDLPTLAPEADEEFSDDDYAELPRPTFGKKITLDEIHYRLSGLSRPVVRSLDEIPMVIVSNEELQQSKPYSDKDPVELKRELEEYIDALRRDSLREAFDNVVAVGHATVTEPPRDPFLADHETQALQEPQQACAAAAHAQHSMAPREPRSEASMDEIIQNGKKWMNDEVMLCFEKLVERSDDLAGLEYRLEELCQQCFNVERYNKVYHHYNFTIRMKMANSVDWIKELYFAEVKEIFGRKFYFCCPLDPNENGDCYACMNQGVEDLKHPATGGFEMGLPDASVSNFWYTDE